MSRNKDTLWTINPDLAGKLSWAQVQVCVLMDIRDELKRMNEILHCPNFIDIPRILRRVRANTARPRKRVAKRPATKLRRAS